MFSGSGSQSQHIITASIWFINGFRLINTLQKTAWQAMNKKNHFVYMCHACTLSMTTFSLSDGALDTRANQMKPQLAVSYPDKINRHQFGGDCQVMMAEGGEKSHENVVNEDLVVKRNSTSALWTYFRIQERENLCRQLGHPSPIVYLNSLFFQLLKNQYPCVCVITSLIL